MTVSFIFRFVTDASVAITVGLLLFMFPSQKPNLFCFKSRRIFELILLFFISSTVAWCKNCLLKYLHYFGVILNFSHCPNLNQNRCNFLLARPFLWMFSMDVLGLATIVEFIWEGMIIIYFEKLQLFSVDPLVHNCFSWTWWCWQLWRTPLGDKHIELVISTS